MLVTLSGNWKTNIDKEFSFSNTKINISPLTKRYCEDQLFWLNRDQHDFHTLYNSRSTDLRFFFFLVVWFSDLSLACFNHYLKSIHWETPKDGQRTEWMRKKLNYHPYYFPNCSSSFLVPITNTQQNKFHNPYQKINQHW